MTDEKLEELKKKLDAADIAFVHAARAYDAYADAADNAQAAYDNALRKIKKRGIGMTKRDREFLRKIKLLLEVELEKAEQFEEPISIETDNFISHLIDRVDDRVEPYSMNGVC